MAHIRSKNVNGRTRYQVVEAHRVGDRVRHKVLGDLGRYPTIEEAVAALRKQAAEHRQAAETVRQRGQGGHYYQHRAARAEAEADALAELPMYLAPVATLLALTGPLSACGYVRGTCSAL